MKYAIEYEHLQDELITDKASKWHFNQVKETANRYKLELSDEDFKRLFKLQRADKDIGWIMDQMSILGMSLVDALVSYIVY